MTMVKAHKTRWLALVLLISICGVGMSGCGGMGASMGDSVEAATATSMPTAVPTGRPSVTPSLTPTAEPSLTPTVTPTAGPSPTLAPTPVFGSARVGDDFLFGNQPEGCELPCWQGLVVGESDADDIQTTLDTVFGFNGSYDFLGGLKESEISDLLVTSYRWDLNASPPGVLPGSFSTFARIHKDTRLLEALGFGAISPRFSKYINPQHVLRKLGAPSMMWVKMDTSEDPHSGMAVLMIIYGRGLAILYHSIEARYDDNNVGKVCLGPQPSDMLYYDVRAYLTKPIPDSVDAFSPVQKDLFGDLHTGEYRLEPFESVFGISLEEIAEMAQRPDDLCVSAQMPW